jgi:hypothetical protein
LKFCFQNGKFTNWLRTKLKYLLRLQGRRLDSYPKQ